MRLTQSRARRMMLWAAQLHRDKIRCSAHTNCADSRDLLPPSPPGEQATAPRACLFRLASLRAYDLVNFGTQVSFRLLHRLNKAAPFLPNLLMRFLFGGIQFEHVSRQNVDGLKVLFE
jgi:hypothetical protein